MTVTNSGWGKPDSDGNCAACDYSDGCGTCYAPPGTDCDAMPDEEVDG